jgi:probable phosphoglycerate mutase
MMKVEQFITRFGLMRHAETEWNREKRIQGQKDSPLTSEGRRQARQWGRALSRYSLDHLVTSDLGRATLTANLINQELGLASTVESRLREQDWGEWSGLKVSDLDTDEIRAQERMGWHFRPPSGESRLEVLERSRQALASIARRLRGERVVVVAHGGVIRCLLYRLFARRYVPEEQPFIKPYRLHWVYYDGAGFHLERLNEKI